MTTQEIIDAMTNEQRRACRDSLGDALDIVSEIVGEMQYSKLFAITLTVIESI